MKRLFPIVTVAGVLLLALAASEIALRTRYPSVAAITGVAGWTTGSYEDVTYYWDQYDARLGWVNRPGYRSDERVPFRVTINNDGLRGEREYAREPAEGTLRIAIVGDSTTFGEEVDDDQTLPAQLEAQLPDSEVLNFGVHGYGAGQMLLMLEERVLDWQPDIVVVVYLTLDVFRDPAPEFVHPKPVFTLEAGELAVKNVPVPEATRQSWLVRRSFTAAWLWGRPEVIPGHAADVDHEALLEAIVRRMHEAGAARDLPVVLVHIVDRNTLEAVARDAGFRNALDKVRRVVARSGEHALDLTETLAEAYRADPAGLTARHGHWSGKGNALIAERIARHLELQGLLADLQELVDGDLGAGGLRAVGPADDQAVDLLDLAQTEVQARVVHR
jgi:lysophospholipase L1-like esterase